MRKTLLGLLVASSLGAISLAAQSAVDIVVGVAPPPLRYERVPTYERRGYIWEQGYWRWNGRRHVWMAGHWERHRPGYTYYAPRWEEHDGRWAFQARRWDRDGDGVPDRYDRRPDNPYRN